MAPTSKNNPPKDSQFAKFTYKGSELPHQYGPNVHLLSDPLLLTYLSRLCEERTVQPFVNELITKIYDGLLQAVVNQEFPRKEVAVETRMSAFHPEGVYQGPIVDPETKVVTTNLARAGTLPSHICYTKLNYFINPAQVRQDHINISRTTSSNDQVTGSHLYGHKIGGPVDDSILLIPDPMGATGGTLSKVIEHYSGYGRPLKTIAMHCIVTPEYLKHLQTKHPHVLVYAIRLDRGLSPKEILETLPGTHWDQEKGLNSKSYIVPGGGGLGEVLNNSFV